MFGGGNSSALRYKFESVAITNLRAECVELSIFLYNLTRGFPRADDGFLGGRLMQESCRGDSWCMERHAPGHNASSADGSTRTHCGHA
jgi:hypothetical protein